ncbi:branched-chain amino acid ABC transporter substrate-binding protein [Camelimonas fluminis]|uniref:ABC transporter substrate-binding protein n=1 Tax=Camelimonas fluminis TaxID=1576911 RepID=A0ABV7ULS3_9HYPH|nr:ABC transporter substrate-binding protein [Camelimonas fluminis]GHE61239.1 branched-chain amino acid ABC transporter substrate-binding protein [Camelimonas fluminis]
MGNLTRRDLLGGAAALSSVALTGTGLAGTARAAGDAEIVIGTTTSLSGPVSSIGVQARAEEAYFNMINDQGGVGGRKIRFMINDDGFNPAKTLEHARRMLENDRVLFLFGNLGTATNSAIVKYVNEQKTPHLFLGVVGHRWGDYQKHPWTMGFGPNGRTEARIFAKYVLGKKPDATFGILYQNDDYGRDYLLGVRDVLGEAGAARITAAPYEVTGATVDSQITALRAANTDALLLGVTPKFGAQAIRRVYEMQWKPKFYYLCSGSASINGVINPAGPERAVGIMSGGYMKDTGDSRWANDPGTQAYLSFMKKYFPAGNTSDLYVQHGFTVAELMVKVLRQCNGDITRERIMKEAANLKNVELSLLLPGIRVNTSPTDYFPIKQFQLMDFNGRNWNLQGEVIGDPL